MSWFSNLFGSSNNDGGGYSSASSADASYSADATPSTGSYDVLGAGTQLLETGMNYYNTKQTNKTNKEIADAANAASAQQAREQMEFQERLSNSAYQRSMSDMKKAGLNPILAYSQGGASTPSGSQGSVTAAKMEAPRIEGLTNTALSLAQNSMQLRRDDSTIGLQDQQKVQTQASTQQTLANTEKARIEAAKTLQDAKQQAQIHRDQASARSLAKMQADYDRNTLQYDKINQKIQTGAQSVEAVGDAAWSFLPNGKVIKRLLGIGGNSATDLQRGSRTFHNKRSTDSKNIKHDPYTGEF